MIDRINRDPYYLNKDLIKLIGVAGEAEHGKGTFCEVATARFNFVEDQFSKPVKEIARKVFNWTRTMVSTSEGKASFDNYWNMTVRRGLQLIGDDALKPIFGNDIWVKNFHQRLFEHFTIDNITEVILSDLRFEIEVNYIIAMGGCIVYINRPGYESALTEEERKHSSEVYARETLRKICQSGNSKFHYLENNCSIHEFKNRCVALLNEITLKVA